MKLIKNLLLIPESLVKVKGKYFITESLVPGYGVNAQETGNGAEELL